MTQYDIDRQPHMSVHLYVRKGITAMTAKSSRRELRLSSQDDDLLVEAACLTGMTVSEFMLSRAVHDAEAVVAEHHTIKLGKDAYHRFLEALDQSTSVIPELEVQVRNSRKLKSVN